MPKHPSDGALRRLLDEPVAVAVADEDHASQCPRCQDRMGLMREDDTVVRLALAGEVEMTPAAVALERLRTAERAGLVLVGGRAGGRLGREAGPRRPRRRRPLLRPATVITSALVLMGGATAAAATGLVPIFSPESVAPVVIQAGDIASLQALSRFGTVTGTSKLDLTPESSATALASAAGFSLPTVTPPSGAGHRVTLVLVGQPRGCTTAGIRGEGGAGRGQGRRHRPARSPRCGRFGPAGGHGCRRPGGVGLDAPRGRRCQRRALWP